MNISTLVRDHATLARRYGLKQGPFGFRKPQHFYEEIRQAAVMHVFTYEVKEDVNKLFADFLETAFQPPPA